MTPLKLGVGCLQATCALVSSLLSQFERGRWLATKRLLGIASVLLGDRFDTVGFCGAGTGPLLDRSFSSTFPRFMLEGS